MATLLERYFILRDAELNPDDPDFVVPPDTTLQAVQAARQLIRRIELAIIAIATEELVKPINENDIPQAQREALYWSHAVLSNSRSEARRMLQILLARFSGLTPSQILDPGISTDSELQTRITQIARALAFSQMAARR